MSEGREVWISVIRNTVRAALGLTLILLATACREPATEDAEQGEQQLRTTALINGSVTYRERLALTDQAELEVVLEDVSLQDVAAPVLAEQKISSPGQVPIRFELEYRLADIDERRSYAVWARIHDRGRLQFTSDTQTPVLTRGAGREAHLVLVPVKAAANPAPAADPAATATELEGMFSYMADAARFWDCRTGRDYPVSMEGAYIELERAYLNSGITAGEKIHVQLRGRYLERPAMEGNHNEVNLIVDKIEEIDLKKSCAPTEHAALRNTYWKLRDIGGREVTTPEGMQEAHLILAGDDFKARGHAGCNRFFGSFETSGDKLTFSALGSTMMACPDGMDTEQAFLQALGETTRYAIGGQFLTLYAGETPLARLEAVYL